MIACFNETTEIVSDLLQSGVSPDSLDRMGMSALIYASLRGNTEIAELLLRYGATADMISSLLSMSALTVATVDRNTEIIQLLLSHRAQVDLQVNGGFSALMMAVKRAETVQLLLEHGAQVDLKDDNGETALMEASKEGYSGTIRVLLKKNAQIDLRDNNGITSLMKACFYDHTEAVIVLLEHGAQVDLAENIDQQTALIYASVVNHIEIVQLLLKHRANVNWRDKHGGTALMHVARHNKTKNVSDLLGYCNQEESPLEKFLSDNGIPVKKNDDKWSSLKLGSSELIKLLLDHGAEVDLQDDDGLSALIAASRAGNIEVVKLLLEHNAQVHLANKNGFTALTFASASKSSEIVRLLISHGKKEKNMENKDEKATLQNQILSDHPEPGNDKKQDQVVIATASAPAQGEDQEIPRSKTGEGQDKHTPPSDNKESSEVNPPLPAIPVQYTEIPQPPSTIGKKRKKPATKTDVKRPKASVSTIGKKQEKFVTSAEKHTLPSDNRELIEVNHPPLAIPEGHTKIPQLPYVKVEKEQVLAYVRYSLS